MSHNILPFINGRQRPNGGSPVARERFTPNESNRLFLNECRKRGYDVSTIINLALETFQPKARSSYFTWEGIENVVSGKKKWF
jgi:hypothetical protein